MAAAQGDQIGRIFAFWVLVFFCQFFLKITEVAQKVGLLFFTCEVNEFI
jgi:hypothetical protein